MAWRLHKENTKRAWVLQPSDGWYQTEIGGEANIATQLLVIMGHASNERLYRFVGHTHLDPGFLRSNMAHPGYVIAPAETVDIAGRTVSYAVVAASVQLGING